VRTYRTNVSFVSTWWDTELKLCPYDVTRAADGVQTGGEWRGVARASSLTFRLSVMVG